VSKHTPGPWHIDKAPTKGWPITRTGDYYISSAPMRGDKYGDEMADLHLIAAAPDLLEALKGMRKRYGKNQYCSDPECLICKEEIAITVAADAAIAKAEGRKP
jgi:hypothetical protein